jgi:sporulation protein YlmC with PRC-barrel domain
MQMNNSTNSTHAHPGAFRFRASQLIDCPLTNTRQEGLGDVQDIVLASDNRTIAYVVVAFGGFLGMGEKFFAMPWRLIEVSRNAADSKPRINLAVEQEVLKAAPGFDKEKWPDMADMTWSRKIDDFYSTRGVSSDGATRSRMAGAPVVGARSGHGFGRDPNSESFQCRRVSQLLGMEVVGANRAAIAKVEDLVLDVERAQIDGAALSFGGVIGMGKRIALVPVESLTLDRSKGTFSVPCTVTDLEAMTLPGGEWPVLDGDEWLARGRRQCELANKARGGPISAGATEA